MTNVDRRMFDELARCLRSNKVGNALILQVADVCARANHNFKRDWFLDAAGYTSITPRVKLLKLGNKTRVVPITPAVHTSDDPYPADNHVTPLGWDEIPAGCDSHRGTDSDASFAPPTKEENK